MQPKKSLGQNFLKDPVILNRILASANLQAEDFVIEVGPGTGVLTKELANKAKQVLAIEIDTALTGLLKKEFQNIKNLEIINNDILKVNLPEIIKEKIPSIDQRPVYKVIANIPYYITSPIIRLFLETAYPPQEMLLMIQKEVAERICAQAGSLSILAISVQYYATPEYLFTVDKKSFYPAPAVDSAVIRITRKEKDTLATSEQNSRREEGRNFFRVVRAGFAAKRKTLLNNLASSLALEKSTVENILAECSLPATTRAQELSLADWQRLVGRLSEKDDLH